VLIAAGLRTERENGQTLAEPAGEISPDQMQQRPLCTADWNIVVKLKHYAIDAVELGDTHQLLTYAAAFRPETEPHVLRGMLILRSGRRSVIPVQSSCGVEAHSGSERCPRRERHRHSELGDVRHSVFAPEPGTLVAAVFGARRAADRAPDRLRLRRLRGSDGSRRGGNLESRHPATTSRTKLASATKTPAIVNARAQRWELSRLGG
jgi:hypothetical protein